MDVPVPGLGRAPASPGSPSSAAEAAGVAAAAMAAFIRSNSTAHMTTRAGSTTSTIAPIFPPMLNATNGTQLFIEDDDMEDLGYSDLQIVFLASIFTLAPLLGILLSIMAVRFVWRKFQEDILDEESDDMLRRADTSNFSQTRQSLSVDQFKASESQFSVLPPEELEEVRSAPLRLTNHNDIMMHNSVSSRTSNGPIITMTMDVNHLIVEKEEMMDPDDEGLDAVCPCCPGGTGLLTDLQQQTAIVHYPPATEQQPTIATAATATRLSSGTGFSQSDLSATSEGSTNPAYTYGNQVGYDCGAFGYPAYCGYTVEELPPRPPPPLSVAAPAPLQSPAELTYTSPPFTPAPVQVPTEPIGTDVEQEWPEGAPCSPEPPEPLIKLVTVNGNSWAEDTEGADDSITDDACSIKAQDPPLDTITDKPLRSPILEKIRLEDASPVNIERYPECAGHKTPPPRSPLAAKEPHESLGDKN